MPADDVSDEAAPRSALLGRVVSHFQVIERIGEGGMGVVYKAVDEKLRRKVALKVLSPRLAADARNREILFREARSAAAVGHPNIAAIYELEDRGPQPFIAMELVEGESLRARLERGRVPVAEALDVAKQIASALAAAHAAGVVHRDLKPENVMLTTGGRVKVLDFGIAKVAEEAEPIVASSGDEPRDTGALANAPTVARSRATERGGIIGTPLYMSPEQACGAAVDARTDVFAFGVVLYEMLAGERPFDRHTDDPREWKDDACWRPKRDLRAAAPGAARAVADLVTRCLSRDPSSRFRDAGEILARWPALPRSSATVVVAALLAVLAAGAAAAVLLSLRGARTPASLPPPAGTASAAASTPSASPPQWRESNLTSLAAGYDLGNMSMSPDGGRVLYSVRYGDEVRARMRRLPDGAPEEVTVPHHPDLRVVGGQLLGDGAWVAWVKEGDGGGLMDAVWLVDAAGSTRRVRSGDKPCNAVVSPDARLVADVCHAPGEQMSLDVRVGPVDAALEGTPVLASILSGVTWSSDGASLAYARSAGPDEELVEVLELATGQRHEVLRAAHVRFSSLTWPSAPRLVVAEELEDARAPGGTRGTRLVEVDPRTGSTRALGTWSGDVGDIVYAGDRVAMVRNAQQSDVVVGRMTADARAMTAPLAPLADSSTDDTCAGLTRAGAVAFVSERDGTQQLFVQRQGDADARLVPGTEGGEIFAPTATEGLPFDALYYRRVPATEGGAPACDLYAADAVRGVWPVSLTRKPRCGTAIRCAAGGAGCVLGDYASDGDGGVAVSFVRVDLTTGATTATNVRVPLAACISWALSPDARRVACVHGTPSVVEWNLATGDAHETRIVGVPVELEAYSVGYAADGDHVVVIGYQRKLARYVLGSLDRTGGFRPLVRSTEWMAGFAIAHDGTVAVTKVVPNSNVWLLEPAD
jgi:tRNA A-37 threonylcarbamoyl transferase component Bud32